uniref:Uncharacterized protein n=1 Tax=Anguilla anguilla TaxID=7936 RepID=A0A0E9SUY9_ANGAN
MKESCKNTTQVKLHRDIATSVWSL